MKIHEELMNIFHIPLDWFDPEKVMHNGNGMGGFLLL